MRLVIELERPICQHEQAWPNLHWGFEGDGCVYKLVIYCGTCNVRSEVPHAKLMAHLSVGALNPEGGATPVYSLTNEQRERVVHEKEFTPFDRKFLKAWKISIDEPKK